MSQLKEINILGSTYKIIFVESEEERKQYPHLFGCYGITLSTSRIILIQNFDDSLPSYSEEEGGCDCNHKPLVYSALRHEILHAYLNECGLRFCTKGTDSEPWSRNEEMVDWFACLSPKIFKTYSELGII